MKILSGIGEVGTICFFIKLQPDLCKRLKKEGLFYFCFRHKLDMHYFFFIFFFPFKLRFHYTTLAVLKLTMSARLDLKSQGSFCLCLLVLGINGVCLYSRHIFPSFLMNGFWKRENPAKDNLIKTYYCQGALKNTYIKRLITT